MAEGEKSESLETQEVESRRSEPKINPKRIPVVDDNTDAANSLVELLRLDGHEADAVYSAKAARWTSMSCNELLGRLTRKAH
jgi:CheY-like chemotaxis protein